MNVRQELWRDPRVATAKLSVASYEGRDGQADYIPTAIDRLTGMLGWGSDELGPFGNVIPRDARVLIKPNWVMHRNKGPWGIEPLLTHPSIIRAVTESALRSAASQIVVGDAPLQACDFDELLRATGIGEWSENLQAREPRFGGVHDFRRTKCVFKDGIRIPFEDQSPLENFVLFDLGSDSLLEPITDGRKSFRVTQYDPRMMAKTHSRGRHQYLVARHVVESDVIINLPKLKTHRKAGVTCALKNLIGINGNKEYLPHHRIGGSEAGGDCYPGRSVTKRILEHAHDQENATRSDSEARLWNGVRRVLAFGLRLQGDELGVDGAWSGNDTIWRTCLDLNRILLYGRPDGTVADVPQRKVMHIVDAVVAGQGDGPLSPEPLELGLLLGSGSAPAMDWVGARLLGYEPARIPITRGSFDRFRWPITPFSPSDIHLLGDLGNGAAEAVLTDGGLPYTVSYPIGWQDAAVETRPELLVP